MSNPPTLDRTIEALKNAEVALPVLRNILKTAGLQSDDIADEILEDVQNALADIQAIREAVTETAEEIEYWHTDYLEDDSDNGWKRVYAKLHTITGGGE